MEKLFKLQENGTTVKTELLAGLTTFMTMAYIIALNPNLLTNFAVGTPLWNGVFLATCIASAIGTICMAFMANKPFVMAPGMGLNSFFAVVVANIAVINNCEYESAFQAGLVIILVEGIVFLVLTLLKVREKIVEAIPLGVRYGIAPAIGLMLMNIGLGSNVGIYAEGNGFTSPFYIMRDFFGALTPSIIKGSMGDIGYHTMVLTAITAFLGVFVMVVLAKKGIKAAVLLGMLFSSVLYWIGSFSFLGVNPFASLETASFVPPFADMVSTTLFKFDFAGFVNIGWFTAITLIITFCMIDMFDTIGTLVGTASRAGMVDKDGNMVCESGPDKEYGYLATREYYNDFDLTLEFKQLANGNSGVFFRSFVEPPVKVHGWQCEVAPKGFDTAGIYESYGRGWLVQIPDEKEDILREGEWNTLRLKVQGDRVQTWLNGEEMVDITDARIGAAQGRIALQIHDGGGIKVLWRNFRLTTL